MLDPNGQRVELVDLYIDKLFGYRLRYFSEREVTSEIALRFELQDSRLANAKDVYSEHRRDIGSGHVDFALTDFIAEIRALFAVSNNLDAWVRFCLYADGREYFNLNIRRFQYVLGADRETGLAAC